MPTDYLPAYPDLLESVLPTAHCPLKGSKRASDSPHPGRPSPHRGLFPRITHKRSLGSRLPDRSNGRLSALLHRYPSNPPPTHPLTLSAFGLSSSPLVSAAMAAAIDIRPPSSASPMSCPGNSGGAAAAWAKLTLIPPRQQHTMRDARIGKARRDDGRGRPGSLSASGCMHGCMGCHLPVTVCSADHRRTIAVCLNATDGRCRTGPWA